MVRDVGLGFVLGDAVGDEVRVALFGAASTMPAGAAVAGVPCPCVLARQDRAMTIVVHAVITAMMRRLIGVVTT
jgi:hypothetical protein